MSRSNDVLAVLKGLQLIAKASVRTNEEYLRHLWANSSVRDVITNNCTRAKEFTNKITANPSKEFEDVAHFLKETVDRSSLVAESVYRYGATQSNIIPKVNVLKEKPNEVVQMVNNVSNLDISAITLKELEQYLANKYDRVDPSAKEANIQTNEPQPQKSGNLTEPSTVLDPKQFLNDEKYVKEWMQFISEHDPGTKTTSNRTQQEASVPSETVEPIKNVSSVSGAKEPDAEKTIELPELSAVAKQRKVPSSRIGRMASFGSLFAGLGIGTLNELTKGALGLGGSTDMRSAFFSAKNAERIVDTLCRVRGAALKLGQILSIQDSTIVSPQLVKAFDRVRQAADYMPDWQVEQVMKRELGDEWRAKFKSFDDKPFAAASIGQVHRGTLFDDTKVAIKIQYPGVAKSIESDIDNLVGMLKVWDVFPPGIFIDNIVKVC